MENLGFVYINFIGISETDLQLPTLVLSPFWNNKSYYLRKDHFKNRDSKYVKMVI